MSISETSFSQENDFFDSLLHPHFELIDYFSIVGDEVYPLAVKTIEIVICQENIVSHMVKRYFLAVERGIQIPILLCDDDASVAGVIERAFQLLIG